MRSARYGRATRAIFRSGSAARSSNAWSMIGASVKKGDVLARLDEQDYRNKLRASEADLLGGSGSR